MAETTIPPQMRALAGLTDAELIQRAREAAFRIGAASPTPTLETAKTVQLLVALAQRLEANISPQAARAASDDL